MRVSEYENYHFTNIPLAASNIELKICVRSQYKYQFEKFPSPARLKFALNFQIIS